jgi:hypothetical protein
LWPEIPEFFTMWSQKREDKTKEMMQKSKRTVWGEPKMYNLLDFFGIS